VTNYCLVNAFVNKNDCYSTEMELDLTEIDIPKFINKCKTCKKLHRSKIYKFMYL